MKEEEKQRILSRHKYNIFQDKDGRWKTTFPDTTKRSGRRLIAKKNYEDLIKEVIIYYSGIEDNEYISSIGYIF
ncbi:MAG: hypothetical protein QM697_17730, partial [Lachnospiraceae bacterium]